MPAAGPADTVGVNAELVDAYLDDLKAARRLAVNTVSGYARDLVLLVRFAEARRARVDRLGRRDLEAFVRELMGSGLAPRSVARTVACVRGFYRFLQVDGHVASSPADELRAPRSWPALPKFLSIDQVDALMNEPDTSTAIGTRDRALIELLYATGLRVSELVSLQPGDLHLDAGYLVCLGKGSKERLVRSAARPRVVRRYPGIRRPAARLGNSTWVFVNRSGLAAVPPGVGFLKRLKQYARSRDSARYKPPPAHSFCDQPARTRRDLPPFRLCSGTPTSRPPRSTRTSSRPDSRRSTTSAIPGPD